MQIGTKRATHHNADSDGRGNERNTHLQHQRTLQEIIETGCYRLHYKVGFNRSKKCMEQDRPLESFYPVQFRL